MEHELEVGGIYYINKTVIMITNINESCSDCIVIRDYKHEQSPGSPTVLSNDSLKIATKSILCNFE